MLIWVATGFLIAAGVVISILLQTTQPDETIAATETPTLRTITIQEETFLVEKEIPEPVIHQVPIDEPQVQLVRLVKPIDTPPSPAQE